MSEFYLPSNDVIFHHLFADESNEDLLTSLLTAVLNPPSPITSVQLLPTERLGAEADDKGVRLDVCVELADGTRVDVEMQNAPREAPRRRTLFCWARLYGTQLARGQLYCELRPCVAIWLLGYRELHGERFHSIFRVQEIHDHQIFSDAFELHLVELCKVGPSEPTRPQSKLELWARFVGARSREELQEVAMRGDPDLEKAWEQVDRLNQDPDTRALAYHRETSLLLYQSDLATAELRGKAEGKAEGRARGRAEGEARGRAEGEARGRAEAVLGVLEARGLLVTEAQRARVLGCTDVETLGRWLHRAVSESSTEEVLAD